MAFQQLDLSAQFNDPGRLPISPDLTVDGPGNVNAMRQKRFERGKAQIIDCQFDLSRFRPREVRLAGRSQFLFRTAIPGVADFCNDFISPGITAYICQQVLAAEILLPLQQSGLCGEMSIHLL